MVDSLVLASKISAIRDAVARIQEVLPDTADAFVADRTAREIVAFNLFLALQEAIALVTHWLADDGATVPGTYGDAFAALGRLGVIDEALATRLRAAAGLRNLIAHQYGVIDFGRLYAIARVDADDLLAFCQQLAASAG